MNPIAAKLKHYLGNPKLKRVNMQMQLTEDQVREYVKCAQNPEYFIENYVKIITLDKGFVQISLYPFQKDVVNDINNNRRVITKPARQEKFLLASNLHMKHYQCGFNRVSKFGTRVILN